MKTVIEVAREADRLTDERLQCPGEFHPDYGTVWNEIFAALVREDEREQCAKLCERLCDSDIYDQNNGIDGYEYANAIRNRA